MIKMPLCEQFSSMGMMYGVTLVALVNALVKYSLASDDDNVKPASINVIEYCQLFTHKSMIYVIGIPFVQM